MEIDAVTETVFHESSDFVEMRRSLKKMSATMKKNAGIAI